MLFCKASVPEFIVTSAFLKVSSFIERVMLSIVTLALFTELFRDIFPVESPFRAIL